MHMDSLNARHTHVSCKPVHSVSRCSGAAWHMDARSCGFESRNTSVDFAGIMDVACNFSHLVFCHPRCFLEMSFSCLVLTCVAEKRTLFLHAFNEIFYPEDLGSRFLRNLCIYTKLHGIIYVHQL
jgi:hypothetical protein